MSASHRRLTQLPGNGGDIVPVLRLKDGRASSKSFRRLPDGTVEAVGYDAGKWFEPEAVTVSGIVDLHNLLARLEGERAVVVRGRLAREATDEGIRRTKGGAEGFLDDAARRWIMLDIDGMPLPDGLTMADPEAVAGHVLSKLGSPWNEADCVWQASNSACIKDGARLHLWFWFDRPVAPEILKAALKEASRRVEKLDHRLWVANQVHYVARPTFEGMEDPLGKRLGLILNGGDLVADSLPVPKLECVQRAVSDGSRRMPWGGAGETVGNVTSLKTATDVALAIRRDIERLAMHRWGKGGVADGSRNDVMLAYGIACAVQSPERVWDLVMDGASRLVPGKPVYWLRQKLSAVLARVERHLAGERVQWDGRDWSPIYTPRRDWFVDLLEITREEMDEAGLTYLVDRAVRRRLERAEKRKDGKRERGRAATVRAVLDALERLGDEASDGEVAEAAGCSASTANRIRNGCSGAGDNICTNVGITDPITQGYGSLDTESREQDTEREVENDRGVAQPAPSSAPSASGISSKTLSIGPGSPSVVPFRPRNGTATPRVPLPPSHMPSSFAARLRCIRYAILYGHAKDGMDVEELAELHGWPAATVRAVISGGFAEAS